jgi:DNA primase
MPLRWDEVVPGLDPQAFTVRTAGDWIACRGDDPWAEIGQLRQKLPGG